MRSLTVPSINPWLEHSRTVRKNEPCRPVRREFICGCAALEAKGFQTATPKPNRLSSEDYRCIRLTIEDFRASQRVQFSHFCMTSP